MSDETIQRYKRELERVGVSPRDVALGMLTFYRLQWGTWEEGCELWFASTEKLTDEEFQSLCDSLVPEASAAAIEKAGGQNSNWVGWREIVESMSPLLEGRGFKPLRPFQRQACFDGGSIIDDEASAVADTGTFPARGTVRAPDSVIEYNRRANEAMERDHHERNERERSWTCRCGRQLEQFPRAPFRRHIEDNTPECGGPAPEESDPPATMRGSCEACGGTGMGDYPWECHSCGGTGGRS